MHARNWTVSSQAKCALKLEDALRHHAASGKIAECKHVAKQAPATVDVRLWPSITRSIHGQVPRDMGKCPAKWVTASLGREVKRVGDLRVAQPHTGTASELDAEMHTTRCLDLNHRPKRGETTRKIDIFLPAIKWQALVEPKAVLAHRRQTNRHVAAVAGECWPDTTRYLGCDAPGLLVPHQAPAPAR